MSYDKVYSGGWQDGSTGQTPINADALNHMEQGIIDGDEQYKWHIHTASDISIAANSYVYYTAEDVTMPVLTGYTRFIIPRCTSSVAVVTGWAFDSDNHPFLYLRNLTSSAATVTVRMLLMHLKNSVQWT